PALAEIGRAGRHQQVAALAGGGRPPQLLDGSRLLRCLGRHLDKTRQFGSNWGGGFNRSRQHCPTGTRQRVDAATLDWAGASPEFCEGGGSSELRRRLGSWARIG